MHRKGLIRLALGIINMFILPTTIMLASVIAPINIEKLEPPEVPKGLFVSNEQSRDILRRRNDVATQTTDIANILNNGIAGVLNDRAEYERKKMEETIRKQEAELMRNMPMNGALGPASTVRTPALGTRRAIEPVNTESNYFNIPVSSEWQKYIRSRAKHYGIDPKWFIASIAGDNPTYSFYLETLNSNGSVNQGLTQIDSNYGKWMSELAGIPSNQFNGLNAAHTLDASLAYLQQLKKTTGHTENGNLFILYKEGAVKGQRRIDSGNTNSQYLSNVNKAYRELILND